MVWVGFVLALFVYQAVIFIGSLLTALQASRYGVVCEEIGIGIGPSIASFKAFSIPIRINLIPNGGYAKFPSDESDQLEALESKSFDTLPATAQIAHALLASLVMLAVGIVFIQVAALLPDSNLVVMSDDQLSTSDHAKIVAYPAAPGISMTGSSLTWASAIALFRDAIIEFWIRFFTFDSLKNWAGGIGWLLMAGDFLGTHLGAFFTTMGVLFWSGVLFNLAPVPGFPGGRVLMILIDCFGFNSQRSATTILTGAVFMLVLAANLLWLDFKWFGEVFGIQ